MYDRKFYEKRDGDTRYAAKIIANIVRNYFEVNTVIDIGCGTGSWLKAFKNMGAKEILGLDGDYVDRNMLVIDKKNFVPANFEKKIKIPKKFDLLITLEVAEHISFSRAGGFVRDLCQLSDVILFSAATKLQGGDGHINEQRMSYWKKKFEHEDYVMLDVIRKKIWNNTKIPVWYRQNVVIFVKKEVYENLNYKCQSEDGQIVDIIHPELYEQKILEFQDDLFIQMYFRLKKYFKYILRK